MKPGDVARTVVGHWFSGWRDAMASAVAAALSWSLAQVLFDHPRPLFAAISAIICLSPGLPGHGHGLQAVNMMLGVTIGIVVGELFLAMPMVNWALEVAIITFFAMMAALSFGLVAVTAIQAGVSAILVIAFGPMAAGQTRLMDVAAGAAVGLIFSQIVLTPDPRRMIDNARRNMLQMLARGFTQSTDALAEVDQRKAQEALRHFFVAHASLDALQAEIVAARSSARWSLRGRLAAREVTELAARYECRAMRLYASTLLFGEALANALRGDDAPPAWLKDRVARIAIICRMMAGESQVAPTLVANAASHPAYPPSWHMCIEPLRAVEEALDELQEKSRSSAPKLSLLP